MKKQICPK